jgi:hypothetical protein
MAAPGRAALPCLEKCRQRESNTWSCSKTHWIGSRPAVPSRILGAGKRLFTATASPRRRPAWPPVRLVRSETSTSARRRAGPSWKSLCGFGPVTEWLNVQVSALLNDFGNHRDTVISQISGHYSLTSKRPLPTFNRTRLRFTPEIGPPADVAGRKQCRRKSRLDSRK